MVSGSTWRTRAAGLGALALVLSTAASATAQSSGDQAAAEALFKQGRDLMASGHLAEACPKLAESQRLDPGTGTLLNLATCYERNGQLASAWVTYKEAATAAQKPTSPSARSSRDARPPSSSPSCRPSQSWYPPPRTDPTCRYRRDGEAIGRPGWGVPIPVDPGVHSVEARRAGRKAWQGQASIEGVAAQASLEVPPLAELPTDTATRRHAPAVGGACGVRGCAAASASLAPMPRRRPCRLARVDAGCDRARDGRRRRRGPHRRGDVRADRRVRQQGRKEQLRDQLDLHRQGFASNNSALHAATASTVAFVAGGVLTAAGLVLYLTAPSGSAAIERAAWSCRRSSARQTGGLTLHGEW